MSFNPYLYFNGRCEEAFRFYEKCLGGKITFMMTWEGSPMAGQAPVGCELLRVANLTGVPATPPL